MRSFMGVYMQTRAGGFICGGGVVACRDSGTRECGRGRGNEPSHDYWGNRLEAGQSSGSRGRQIG